MAGVEGVERAYLLSEGAAAPALDISSQDGEVVIAGPDVAPDPVDTVIVLEIGA